MERVELEEPLHYEGKNSFILNDSSIVLVPCTCYPTRAFSKFCDGEKHVQSISIDIDTIPIHGIIFIKFYFFSTKSDHNSQHIVIVKLNYTHDRLKLKCFTSINEKCTPFIKLDNIYWPKRVKNINNVIVLTFNSHVYSLSCEFNDLPIFNHSLVKRSHVDDTNIYRVLICFETYHCHEVLQLKIDMVRNPFETAVIDRHEQRRITLSDIYDNTVDVKLFIFVFVLIILSWLGII